MGHGGRRPNSGPKKGAMYKNTKLARQIADSMGVNAIQTFCIILQRKAPCGTCIDKDGKPTGKTWARAEDGKDYQRVCQSCWGTLLERVDLPTWLKAAEGLAKYTYTTLKAVEHTGEDGGAIEHEVTVKYLK